MKPDIHHTVINKQSEQVKNRRSAKIRQFTVGQSVLARDYRRLQKWLPTVVSCNGPNRVKLCSEFTPISVLSTKLSFIVVDKLFLESETGKDIISSCESEMLASSKT